MFAGVTQPARVTAFQAVGRGFESRLPLQSIPVESYCAGVFAYFRAGDCVGLPT